MDANDTDALAPNAYDCYLQSRIEAETSSELHQSGVVRPFTFTYAPEVNSLIHSAPVGAMTGGMRVNVSGIGFPNSISQGGLAWLTAAGCVVERTSSNLIVCVTKAQQSSNGVERFTVQVARTVPGILQDKSANPRLKNISPQTGSSGTVLTLTGDRFVAGGTITLTLVTGHNTTLGHGTSDDLEATFYPASGTPHEYTHRCRQHQVCARMLRTCWHFQARWQALAVCDSSCMAKTIGCLFAR